jgi:hypothetical protein
VRGAGGLLAAKCPHGLGNRVLANEGVGIAPNNLAEMAPEETQGQLEAVRQGIIAGSQVTRSIHRVRRRRWGGLSRWWGSC